MKKRILQVISLLICFVLICVCGIPNTNEHIFIEDERLPLENSVGTLLREQEEDIMVIPDKYNTGAKGELTPVTSDCYISGVKFGTTGSADRKLDLFYQPKGVEIPATIVVENYDFSSGDFREYNVSKVSKNVTIIYRNCKFGSYVITGDGLVKRQFENCTFTHFAGSDATFVNCYFGGGADGDGINPMQNCTFTNCMIADLIQPAESAGDKHIDGFQIFGSGDGTNNENIVLNNCRFEVPSIPMTSPSGALNCPLSVIMRYSDAKNIIFNDCYVNGGQYYAVMLLAYDHNVTNLAIKNMHIGGASKSLYTCDPAFESIIDSNASATDSLYVASVRKMEDGIHLSVTNDTNQERVLSVVTSAGVEKYVVSPCYKGIDLQADTVSFDDFPFDEEVIIPNADWVACFDTTDVTKQIRFVNWTNEDVYVDLEVIFPKKNGTEIEIVIPEQKNPTYDTTEDVIVEESNNEVIINPVKLEGTCGDNVSYLFEDGILYLIGSGETYNYHSGSTAPWYDVKENIKELHVESGVTYLGNQLMTECTNLTTVILSEGFNSIGSNVFKRCNQIEYIYIPRTLEKVGKRSFTADVEKVEFAGTVEEWNKISFDAYNDGLLKAEIICETILYSGVCGENVEWSFTSSGRLILAGTGKTYDYHSGNTPPWYEYADEIKEIIIEEGITAIGNFSFRDCKNVYEIKLPETVTYVGTNSFSRCKSLSEITFTSAMTSIGKNAFASTNISKVYFYGETQEWNAITGNSLTQAEVIYK